MKKPTPQIKKFKDRQQRLKPGKKTQLMLMRNKESLSLGSR